MKDIYKLLNNTNNEHSEADPLTDEEAKAIMKRFRNEINSSSKKTSGNKKTITIITAIILAACCGTTVMAAERLGVFDKLIHKNDMSFTWYDDGGVIPIDKFAVPYDYEKIAEAADKVTDTITAESDGLTIQVDSVYCDGTTLMIGISGSMKDGNPEHKNLINLDYIKMNINGKLYDDMTPGVFRDFASLEGSLVLDEGTDNLFSGSIDLIVFGDSEITGETTAEITVDRITAQEHYMDKNYVELGELSLSVNVKPDTSLKDCEPYTINDDEYSVRFYEISPAMVVVGFMSPDEELQSWLYDENGEKLAEIDLYMLPDYGDGYSIGCMVPVTSGYVTAKFFNKNIHDEDGNIIINKEIRINMNEVYAALKGDQ